MKPKILIAEDKPAELRPFEEYLRRHYDVRMAPDVKQAVAMLEANRDRPIDERLSVAVIDLDFTGHLPNERMAGFAIIKEAVRDDFLEPIILTGTGDETKASLAFQSGVFRYVIKGKMVNGKTATENLMEAIRDAIEFRTHLLHLSRTIDALRQEIARLEPTDPARDAVISLAYVAEQMFLSILHLRGKRPKDEQAKRSV